MVESKSRRRASKINAYSEFLIKFSAPLGICIVRYKALDRSGAIEGRARQPRDAGAGGDLGKARPQRRIHRTRAPHGRAVSKICVAAPTGVFAPRRLRRNGAAGNGWWVADDDWGNERNLLSPVGRRQHRGPGDGVRQIVVPVRSVIDAILAGREGAPSSAANCAMERG